MPCLLTAIRCCSYLINHLLEWMMQKGSLNCIISSTHLQVLLLNANRRAYLERNSLKSVITLKLQAGLPFPN